jgi:predicted ATP-grasp superfamily ATP-dependent carboligase
MGILLLGADYYGTLAAVRCLGETGVPVYVADENKGARALFSKFTKERLVHPAASAMDDLVQWLAAFGRQHPGTVLYPTNDHLAWLLAARHAELKDAFHTYQPSPSVILTLLDKKRLGEACAAVGIDTPATAYADSDESLAAQKAQFPYPLLIKPRTQVYLETGIKGSIVSSAGELDQELARYRSLVRFHPAFLAAEPGIDQPLFQEYRTAAETSIFSMSGFVTEDGRMSARASMKVLQRPRKVGIGLCFEAKAMEPELLSKLQALCKHVGYHGAFEVEFIADGDKRLLIDFNPRFFSQMAFDIARGSKIPLFVYHAARGDTAALGAALDEADRAGMGTGPAYVHRTMLDLVLTLQGASRQMSPRDIKHWRGWLRDHKHALTDAVRYPGDPMPAMIDAAQWVKHFAKHPRSFVRSFVLNR